MFLIQTYSIEDCLYFDSQTTDKSRYTTVSGGANISYSTNGVTIAGSQATDTYVKNTALTLPTNYIAECTMMGFTGKLTGNPPVFYGGLCFDDMFLDFNSAIIAIYKLSSVTKLTEFNHSLTVRDVIKIEMQSGTVKVYVNNTLKATVNNISHTGFHQHRTYRQSGENPRSLTVKDLKIKPL